MEQLHDALVFQIGLIVQVPAELLGELGHGPLGVLAGLQPVVVDPLQADVRIEGADGGKGEDLLQKVESSSCRAGDIKKSQKARKLRP